MKRRRDVDEQRSESGGGKIEEWGVDREVPTTPM